jgi:hypothetical protein
MKNQLRLRLEYQPPQSVRVIKLIDKSVAAACLDRDDGRYLQRPARVKRSLFRRSRRRPKPRSLLVEVFHQHDVDRRRIDLGKDDSSTIGGYGKSLIPGGWRTIQIGDS